MTPYGQRELLALGDLILQALKLSFLAFNEVSFSHTNLSSSRICLVVNTVVDRKSAAVWVRINSDSLFLIICVNICSLLLCKFSLIAWITGSSLLCNCKCFLHPFVFLSWYFADFSMFSLLLYILQLIYHNPYLLLLPQHQKWALKENESFLESTGQFPALWPTFLFPCVDTFVYGNAKQVVTEWKWDLFHDFWLCVRLRGFTQHCLLHDFIRTLKCG